MRIGHRLAASPTRVGEQRQLPSRRNLRVELPQAARRRVARIGEDRLPRLRLRLVQCKEIRLGHEHFAADLDQRRRVALQSPGDRPHGAEIGRHVLAHHAVAARRAVHECAVLIGQVDRKPVDLRLADEGERRVRLQPEEAPRAGAELGKSASPKALSSDSIGRRWRSLAKPLSGASPTGSRASPHA